MSEPNEYQQDIVMDAVQPPLQERHYYKLLLANVICLAVTCILVTICICQVTRAVESIQHERREILAALEIHTLTLHNQIDKRDRHPHLPCEEYNTAGPPNIHQDDGR
jgi:hypothetical protein